MRHVLAKTRNYADIGRASPKLSKFLGAGRAAGQTQRNRSNMLPKSRSKMLCGRC